MIIDPVLTHCPFTRVQGSSIDFANIGAKELGFVVGVKVCLFCSVLGLVRFADLAPYLVPGTSLELERVLMLKVHSVKRG